MKESNSCLTSSGEYRVVDVELQEVKALSRKATVVLSPHRLVRNKSGSGWNPHLGVRRRDAWSIVEIRDCRNSSIPWRVERNAKEKGAFHQHRDRISMPSTKADIWEQVQGFLEKGAPRPCSLHNFDSGCCRDDG